MALSGPRLVRLVVEELEKTLAPERALELARTTFGAPETLDPDQVFVAADGVLRATLLAELGLERGSQLANRVCRVLMRHVSSGIRAKEGLGAEQTLTVGVIESSEEGRARRLAAGVESLGFRAVLLTVDQLGGVRTKLIDAFLVPADLPLPEARELAWRNAQREEPALVVVWPITGVEPAWGKALGEPVFLEIASFARLAKTLASHLGMASDAPNRKAGTT